MLCCFYWLHTMLFYGKLFLLVATTLLIGFADGCLPLISNGTVEYGYFKVQASGDTNIQQMTVEAEDGRYPDGTFARMLCRNVAERDQETDKEIIGQCSRDKWEMFNPIDLKCPGGCDFSDVADKQNFASIIVDVRQAVKVYMKPGTFSTLYIPGSEMQARCKGVWTDLVCFDGEWHARHRAGGVESLGKVRCSDNGVVFD